MSPESGEDASIIKDKGWRQGSVLSATLLGDLIADGLIPGSFSHLDIAIVISHDCDVTHVSLASEPTVEVLIGQRVDAAHPDFIESKSPRKYHLKIGNDDTAATLEFLAHQRFAFSRQRLAIYQPESSLALSQDEISRIALWVARRYTRAAFPDEFNKRTRAVTQKVRGRLKKNISLFSGIYLFLQDEELEAEKSYNVDVCGVMFKEKFEQETLRTKAQGLIGGVEAALNGCEGVDVGESEVRPDDEFSLNDVRFWKRWDFDELSFRAGDLDDLRRE